MSKPVRYYLRPGNTDMRKSINGLSLIVQENMAEDPFSGSMFLFTNKSRRVIKILYWDINGFCLWMKRLEKNKFPWPKKEDRHIEITQKEMDWLLSGIDFFSRHEEIRYSRII